MLSCPQERARRRYWEMAFARTTLWNTLQGLKHCARLHELTYKASKTYRWVQKQVVEQCTLHHPIYKTPTPTWAEWTCTFYEGIYYTGNYTEKGLEGSLPNKTDGHLFRERGRFIRHVWVLDLRSVLLFGLAVLCSPFQTVPLSLSTCPVLGEANCTDGQPHSLVSGGRWQQGPRSRTRYVLSSRGVPLRPLPVTGSSPCGSPAHCLGSDHSLFYSLLPFGSWMGMAAPWSLTRWASGVPTSCPLPYKQQFYEILFNFLNVSVSSAFLFLFSFCWDCNTICYL